MSTPTPDYYLKRIPLSEKDKENGYVTVDPYRIARLWELKDPALFQAFKKTLCGGQRGGKDLLQDVKEARDALSRWLELEGVTGYTGPKCDQYLWEDRAGSLIRMVPDGTNFGRNLKDEMMRDRWVSLDSPCYMGLGSVCISEAKARALVEKAGGVW